MNNKLNIEKLVKLFDLIDEEVLEEQQKGNVVFFVGAGVSKHKADLPLFEELLLEILSDESIIDLIHKKYYTDYDVNNSCECNYNNCCKKLNLNEKHKYKEFSSIFNELFMHYYRDIIDDKIKSILKDKTEKKLEEYQKENTLSYHKNIVDISRNKNNKIQIITTNFDELFKKIKEESEKDTEIYYSYDIPLNIGDFNDKGGIVHLHNTIKNRKGFRDHNIIYSTEDYAKNYMLNNRVRDFLIRILDKYTLVFIGYSLGDLIINYILHASDKTKEHYIFSNKERKNEKLKHINLKIDKDDDKTYYNELYDIIEIWANFNSLTNFKDIAKLLIELLYTKKPFLNENKYLLNENQYLQLYKKTDINITLANISKYLLNKEKLSERALNNYELNEIYKEKVKGENYLLEWLEALYLLNNKENFILLIKFLFQNFLVNENVINFLKLKNIDITKEEVIKKKNKFDNEKYYIIREYLNSLRLKNEDQLKNDLIKNTLDYYFIFNPLPKNTEDNMWMFSIQQILESLNDIEYVTTLLQAKSFYDGKRYEINIGYIEIVLALVKEDTQDYLPHLDIILFYFNYYLNLCSIYDVQIPIFISKDVFSGNYNTTYSKHVLVGGEALEEFLKIFLIIIEKGKTTEDYKNIEDKTIEKIFNYSKKLKDKYIINKYYSSIIYLALKLNDYDVNKLEEKIISMLELKILSYDLLSLIKLLFEEKRTKLSKTLKDNFISKLKSNKNSNENEDYKKYIDTQIVEFEKIFKE